MSLSFDTQLVAKLDYVSSVILRAARCVPLPAGLRRAHNGRDNGKRDDTPGSGTGRFRERQISAGRMALARSLFSPGLFAREHVLPVLHHLAAASEVQSSETVTPIVCPST